MQRNQIVPPNAPLLRTRQLNFGPVEMMHDIGFGEIDVNRILGVRIPYLHFINDRRSNTVNIKNCGERSEKIRLNM